MSLLSIISDASDIIGLPTVSQVIGNNDKNVRQMLALLQSGGDALARMTNSQGGSWVVLDRIREFQSVIDETEYDLPDDFKSLLTETAWIKEKYWKMRGSLNPRQWQTLRNRSSTTAYNVFRIVRGTSVGTITPGTPQNAVKKFTLEPAPGDSETLVYEYRSNAWWISSDGNAFKKRPTADTDESLFGDEISLLDVIWRFKQQNGLNYAADLAIFEDSRDTAFAQDGAFESIPIGYDRRSTGNKDESDVEWCR